MITQVNQPVTVTLRFTPNALHPTFKSLIWNHHSYSIEKLGLHHTYKQGSQLYHIFTVNSSSLSFRLKFDPQSLRWILQEVADGLSS